MNLEKNRVGLLIQLFILALSASSLADTPLLKNEQFELLLHPEAKIISQFDNGWETFLVVEHEGQRVRVNWKEDQALLLFPNSTIRLKSEATPSGGSNITTFVDGERYEVKRSAKEIGWLLPGQQIYFQTWGGQISQAVGTADYLKLHRDSISGRLKLESSVGVTDALLNSKGQLETFDGPEYTEHLYLVRGLAFKQGPVTVRVPLPQGPFLKGLPSDRFLLVEKEMVPLAEPAAVGEPEERRDPLQAQPPTWDSPQLRAKFNEPTEDPLSVKKERRVRYDEDPLKAKTSKDSEEILRVKSY